MINLSGYRSMAQRCANTQKINFLIVKCGEYRVIPYFMFDNACELIETIAPRESPVYTGVERRRNR